ncbi:MAG TPA: PAS domain S-box protein [Terriglobia bacterium]|nr:PAS domain S-box protein [Terriglobia bacterium]
MATTRKEISFNSPPRLGAEVLASSAAARQRKAKNRPGRAKLLEEIMACSTNAIAALDLEGRFTLANHRVAEITGYAQEELLGQSYTVLLAPKSLNPVRMAITRTLTEGNLISGFETEVVRKDGTIRNVAFNLSPVFAEGKIVGAAGTAEDITERKLAEEALRDSEARFRTMANTAPVMIWMSGPDGGCSFFNERWLEFTGKPMEREIGQGWSKGVHSEDRKRCLGTYRSAFASRETFELEYRLRRADGEYRWVLDTGTPLFGPNKNFAGYIGSCVDITERKQAEEALRESEDRYRDLVENSGILFGTHDARGQVLSVNQSTVKFSGFEKPEQLVGRDLRTFLPPEVKGRFDSYLHQVLDQGYAKGYMKVRLRSGEERILEYNNSLRREGLREPVVRCIGRDVTAGRKAEHALRESEELFRQLAENMRDIVWIVSLETEKVIFANPAFEEITGRTRECLYARSNSVDIIHPDDRERAVAALFKQILEGSDADSEFRIVRPDQSIRWLRSRGFPIRNHQGRVYRVAGVTEDITDRKQAEEALRESEERYRLVAENSQDLIKLLDLQGNVQYASPSHFHVLGFAPEDLLQRCMFEVVHPDDVERVQAMFGELPSSHQSRTLELRVRTKAGDWTDLEAIFSPIADPAGNVKSVLLSARDITERKRAERISRSHEAALARTLSLLAAEPALDTFLGHVLRAITEQLEAPSSALYLYDPEHESAMFQMTYQDGEVRRSPGDRLNPVTAVAPGPGDRESALWLLVHQSRGPLLIEDAGSSELLSPESRAWAAGQGIRTILLVPLLLGEKLIGMLSVRSSAQRSYRPDEVELAQGLAHQATLAVQLTRLAEQGQRSVLLQERNRMAQEIHDTLAQGFTGIIVQLEAAEDAIGERAELREHILKARMLARNSLAEARRSLWALRPQALEHRDLPAAVRILLDQLTNHRPVPASFRLEGAARPLPPKVEDNLLRITQEALNNAFQHAKAKNIEIRLTFGAEEVTLRVQDDGRGFDPGAASNQVGFGLTSMRERTERIGGRIAIESGLGQGTKVQVQVPVTPPVR